MTDPAVLRDLALDFAREAGDLLAGRLRDERLTVATKSTGTDMVTEMDRASEALLVERIVELRPDDAIVGEEGADRPGTSGVTWVIDPLDGTTNYLYRLPGWNVSVAAEVDGEPVAGAVVVPTHGNEFAAARGHGASLDGSPLRLGTAAPLSTSLVGTGFSYDAAVRAQQATMVAALLAEIRDIRRVGAAAADLCAVAAGRLDAYFETGLERWDRSAGTIITREAGYRVETTDDTPLPGTLTVAAHPDRWDEIDRLLRSAGVRR